MAYARIIHEWPGSDAVTHFEVGGDLENHDEITTDAIRMWRECIGEGVEPEPETGL